MLVKDLIALLKKQPKDAAVEVLREVEHAYSVNTEYTEDFTVTSHEVLGEEGETERVFVRIG